MPDNSGAFSANLERFSGFANTYDTFRPQAPPIIPEILCQLASTPRPSLVVDIGCGTGLSTRLWADRAETVIGIEPNEDMRREAVNRTMSHPHSHTIRYQDGLSTRTGLPGGSADVVTCSQSLHWMDPQPTFAEIARILRAGGVFAAIDCDWPPTFNRMAEQAFNQQRALSEALGREGDYFKGVQKWSKDGHLDRIRASNRFQYVKEITAHHREEGDYKRLVGLAMSQGGTATLLKRGLSAADVGLDALRDAARSAMGDSPVPWHWSYRIRIGIR